MFLPLHTVKLSGRGFPDTGRDLDYGDDGDDGDGLVSSPLRSVKIHEAPVYGDGDYTRPHPDFVLVW